MSGWRQLLNHALFCFCFFLCCYGWALAIGHQMSIGRTGDRNLPSIIIFFLLLSSLPLPSSSSSSSSSAAGKQQIPARSGERNVITSFLSPSRSLPSHCRIGFDGIQSRLVFLFLFFFCFSTDVLRLHEEEIYGNGRVGGRVGLLTGLDH